MPNRAKEESKGGDQRVVDVMSTVLRADALLWSRDKKRILLVSCQPNFTRHRKLELRKRSSNSETSW
jgi:hypothetical protein